jgi:very-short-patch-repair endonuclease
MTTPPDFTHAKPPPSMRGAESETSGRSLLKSDVRLPYNPKLKDRARELRKNMTKTEKKLWYNFLSKHSLRFLRQRPIDQYIVDFYCPKKKLIIEIDGSTHFTKDGVEYDAERSSIV